ncbi:hypothetical protein [Actinomadura sp. 3N508]|uniref:hypothetical protein n=1 Tax=Actinomadura sp. 3N508 TaxID=3375153 RepID=UPI00379BCF50
MTTSAAAVPEPTRSASPGRGLVGDVQAPRPDPAPSLPAPTRPPAEAPPVGRPAPAIKPPRPAPDGPDRRSEPGRVRPDLDRRDWVVDLGIAVGGLAAIVASFTSLRHLGAYTGWGRLDWLLPTTLDTFVITTTRVWQSRRTKSAKVRRFAAGNAICAIGLSLAGNAVYHAIHAGAWEPGQHMWLLVVLVSSIPPIAIGLISHLAVLRSRDDEFAAEEAREAAGLAPAPTSPHPAAPRPASTRPAESAPMVPAPAAAPDPTPASAPAPDPTGPPQSAAPHAASGEPTSTHPTDSAQAEQASRKRPAPAPTGMGEDDPLLPDAQAYAAEHFERTGRKIGAEPLATHFGIGTRRSRLLRDAVHGLHEVDRGADS